MAAETISATPSGAPKFGDQVSDRVHVEESPRTSTCTELTAFSEAADLQAERNYHDSACINTRVDDEEREGAERERLSGTGCSGCEHDHSDQAACCRNSDVCHCVHHHRQGSSASEHCNNQHSRCDGPSSADINSDCVQPSSTTNLCDAPIQCADVVNLTVQTTNQGWFTYMIV